MQKKEEKDELKIKRTMGKPTVVIVNEKKNQRTKNHQQRR